MRSYEEAGGYEGKARGDRGNLAQGDERDTDKWFFRNLLEIQVDTMVL